MRFIFDLNKKLKEWSGWQDSNLRPSAPKADALARLRYTPNSVRALNLAHYLKIQTQEKKF